MSAAWDLIRAFRDNTSIGARLPSPVREAQREKSQTWGKRLPETAKPPGTHYSTALWTETVYCLSPFVVTSVLTKPKMTSSQVSFQRIETPFLETVPSTGSVTWRQGYQLPQSPYFLRPAAQSTENGPHWPCAQYSCLATSVLDGWFSDQLTL